MIEEAVTIGTLPVVPPPLLGTDLIPVWRAGDTFQAPVSDIASSVATNPGGVSGQVQYNNSGTFGGLTTAQLTALVNAFSSTLSGAVPASGGGTTNFLRADGTFAAPLGAVSLSGNNTWTGTNTFTKALSTGSSPLTIISTSIATDASLANVFYVTLAISAATTMSAPTNPVDTKVITYELLQPASGSGGTVTWNSIFSFGATGSPTLSTTNGLTDLVSFRYSSRVAKWLCLNGSGLGYS